MRKEVVAVEAAVGHILCHDVTRIVPGEFKGPQFRKGHVIRDADVEPLRQAGKDHIFILELDQDDVHEDEAGLRLGRPAAGPGVRLAGPVESRVNLLAARPGLLKVDVARLEAVNSLPGVVLATLPSNTVVQEGEVVGGTKVIPLVIEERILAAAEAILSQGPVVQVRPFLPKRAGVIVTGGEIHRNQTRDAFAPLLREKLAAFGSDLAWLDFAPDEATAIAQLITGQAEAGAELILVTGGMSVDPDDVTPAGIALAGVEVVQYGAPVLPGAMFLLGYRADLPVLGVPACSMFFRVTILDLILPRLLAGERLSRRDILSLAHGGLCRSCQPCRFPACSFGSGGSW